MTILLSKLKKRDSSTKINRQFIHFSNLYYKYYEHSKIINNTRNFLPKRKTFISDFEKIKQTSYSLCGNLNLIGPLIGLSGSISSSP